MVGSLGVALALLYLTRSRIEAAVVPGAGDRTAGKAGAGTYDGSDAHDGWCWRCCW